MYELVCMKTLQEKMTIIVLRYGQTCMLEKEKKFCTELSNTITTFNDNNNTPLSNVDNQESLLKVIREYE